MNSPFPKTYQAKLDDYEPIVGRDSIEELKMLASKLSGKVIQNINSTFSGGGIAEILSHMVPLFHQLGVDAHWDVPLSPVEAPR